MARFADRPEVEVDVHVAAGPDDLWGLVTDVDLPARFSGEYLGGTWLGGAGPALGARFVGRNVHPARGEWETTSEVIECDPGRVFSWAVGDPANPGAVWRFEMVAEPGGTHLRMRGTLGPGPSGVTMLLEAMPDKEEAIIERRLGEWEANMTATVDGIKALAEGA